MLQLYFVVSKMLVIEFLDLVTSLYISVSGCTSLFLDIDLITSLFLERHQLKPCELDNGQ